MKLDEDPCVINYEYESVVIPYYNPEKAGQRTYRIDLVVNYKDGTKKWIEVKPLKQIKTPINQNKINAAKAVAESQGIEMEVWTENSLGFKDSEDVRKWSTNQKIKKDPNYVEHHKQSSRNRANRHYRNKISKNKVTFFCEFCKEEHTNLQITYDKNIAKNGRFMCIKENGHIVGSKPKTHLQKDNPYADEGKKQCTKCEKIIPFDCFGKDKSRSDGYSSRCKECRATIAKDKYKNIRCLDTRQKHS